MRCSSYAKGREKNPYFWHSYWLATHAYMMIIYGEKNQVRAVEEKGDQEMGIIYTYSYTYTYMYIIRN